MEGWVVPHGCSSAAAALVLVASLAGKLAIHDVDVVEDRPAATQALAASLASHGYAVAIPRATLPIVQAERNGCRFNARVLDPHGTYRDTELLKLPRGWSLAYVWRGDTNVTLPRFGPLIEYYLARERARLGIAAWRAPVIMLSLPPGCSAPNPVALNIRETLKRAGLR
jgi:hypothetical protein